jgi:hypothetical protein
MLAAVELVSALIRRTGNDVLAANALRQLDAFGQVEFSERHRDAAVRLALTGMARGADTAIAAQALVVASASPERLEFVTADVAQARLVRREATRRKLDVTVLQLPS